MKEEAPSAVQTSSPATRVVSIALVLLLLVFCAWPLLGHFMVFEMRSSLDINSGDVRQERAVFRVKLTDTTRASEFSTEAHRLGIATAGQPVWKVMHRQGLRKRHRSSDYLSAAHEVDLLVRFLDTLKTPDDERQVILEKALRNLQGGRPEHIRDQVNALAERLPNPEH